jgi:predicted ABC-type transport system involved in lysophospholipase L1 biosynthesis ATPase subunit
MADASAPLVELRGVLKNYNALRPLRVEQLEIARAQSLALMGLDATAAEVLVSLITGATLPDSGDVRVLGHATAEIADADAWLKWLEHFGLFSERTIIVDELTGAQNLGMPFSMDVEDMSPAVRSQVIALSAEVGLAETELDRPAARLSPAARARLRLGRALALSPRVLLAEHPNAMLSADDTPAFAADLSRIIIERGLAALIITADRTFAAAVAEQVLTLQPATGALKRADGWRRWFS